MAQEMDFGGRKRGVGASLQRVVSVARSRKTGMKRHDGYFCGPNICMWNGRKGS